MGVNATMYAGSEAAALEQDYIDRDCQDLRNPVFSTTRFVSCVSGQCQFVASTSCGMAATCNPVTQQGCQLNEKCTIVVTLEPDDPDPKAPFITNHTCISCGDDDCSLDVGAACVRRPASEDGIDSCVEGAVCFDDACRELCSFEPDSCTSGVCTSIGDLNQTVDGMGACLP